jgi:hypothetical protein
MEGFLQHKVEQNQSLWEDAKINVALNDPNLDLQKLYPTFSKSKS